MLPGMDGYETCRQMRATPALRYTKIIMVSARAMTSERLKGYEAGADDYITKPFNNAELLAKVRVYLRLKSLEEVNQLKSNMLAILSHETAIPLNGIMAPLQMVIDEPDMDPKERTEFLMMAQQSAARLHRLFTKVCTLYAMRAGHWTFEQVPSHLGNLVRAAVNAVAPDAAKRNVQLDLTLCEDATTQLDPGCIQNVMIALLENAIRFSPASGRVCVQTWQEDTQLCVTVADQGPGIAPERLPHVFAPMPQDDISHHTEGQGLSLAIARQVVEAHHGTIGVDSTPGVTTFMIRLPKIPI
jgi:signal transduction histidine kinase